MQAITQSGRWPGNEAIGTHVIYSESEEAAASSASMLGTPMATAVQWGSWTTAICIWTCTGAMNTGNAVWENSMVDLNLELRSSVDPTLWESEVD